MNRLFATLATAALGALGAVAGELPVVTFITLDDGAVYSDNYGGESYPLRLSWLADWEPADTTLEARYFTYVPMFYNADGTFMARATDKESKLTPYVQRDVAYYGTIVEGALVPGPATLAIGYFDADSVFVSYGQKDIEITDGRPGFTLTPSINAGDEGIDPTDFTITLDVRCNRGDGGTWYAGGFWCYVYADEACKSGTSVWKKKISVNMNVGDTRSLNFNVSLANPLYDHTYYYKFAFVDCNGVARLYADKHSFTTMSDGGVDGIVADGNASVVTGSYDLQGRKLTHPTPGTMQIERRADGSVTKHISK